MSEKEKYDSLDIANAIKNVLVMANFSGHIVQTKDGPLLQFSPGSPTSDGVETWFDLEFGGQEFEVIVRPFRVESEEKHEEDC